MVRGGRSLDTLDRSTGVYGHHSGSSSRRHYCSHHRHHPYIKGEYLPKYFKKVKPSTFKGEMKKSEDVEAWLLGLKKFFQLHSYIDNMKAKIATFNLKGKADIWWEDVKNVKGIREDSLTWNEFERLFKKKYLSESYYDDRVNEF